MLLCLNVAVKVRLLLLLKELMKQNTKNKYNSEETDSQPMYYQVAKPHLGPGLKNLAAFHELMRREGYCVPALSSRFATKLTLNQMYRG